MAKIALSVIILFALAFGQALAGECCQTGYDDYTWCDYYCCDPYLLSTYDRCCSSLTNQVSYNSAFESDCPAWFSSHVWAAVLIGLGSLAVFVGIIVCCVCCIKGCANSNRRTGAVVVHQGHQGPGVFMVHNHPATQQMQGAPMPQSNQGAYPPGYAGYSNMGFQPPPSYANSGFEKTPGPPTY